MSSNLACGFVIFLLFIPLVLSLSTVVAYVEPGEWTSAEGLDEAQGAVKAWLSQSPLYFIDNHGQVDEQVGYYVQAKDKTLYFTSEGVTFVLRGPTPHVTLNAVKDLDASGSEEILRFAQNDIAASARRWVLTLDFLGVSPEAQPVDGTRPGLS